MSKYHTPVKWEKGDWRVMRNCCTSGMCFKCHERPAGQPRPARIVQGDSYSEEYAKYVAKNWASYAAVAELMPEVKS